VYRAVTEEKWLKTKVVIQRLRDAYELATSSGGDGMLELKMLEQVAGFLVHVTRAYPRIKVYLNGLYANMNSWQPDRDEEGWKIQNFQVD
jgi:hypothetical protein